MATIAPWLHPQDFLGAIRAGAGLGLQVRERNDAEVQAAETLRQAQESLFQRQQQMAQAAQQAEVENQLKSQAMAQSQAQQQQENMLRAQQLAQAQQESMFQQNRLSQQDVQDTAAAQAFAQGLTPKQVGEGPPKADVVAALSGAMQAGPGSYLAKHVDPDALLKAIQNQDSMAGMSRGLMTYYAQLGGQTGEQILNPILPGGIDQEALARATQKMGGEGGIVQQRLKPAALRTTKALIDDQELESGVKLTPEERAKTERILASYGGKNPTLEQDARSKLNVAEYASSSAAQLLDEISKNPDVKFGPGVFTFNVKTGEWLGADPESSKIAQMYNKLFAGQAFTQGGKQLTQTEINLIKDQIGSPTQANFIPKLQTALAFYTQDLGRGVRDLQARHFDMFPAYEDEIKRWKNQYDDTIKKYGLEVSPAFQAPLSTGSIPSPSERESGKVYETPKGRLKWTGTGWVRP